MKRYTATAVLGVSMLAFSSVGSANGFYLGVGGAYNAVNGDFDGNTLFSSLSSSDILLVPKVEAAWGGTIFGGYSFTSRAAIQIGVTMSSHDATFGARKMTADYTILDFDLKYHFMDADALRPYGLVGFGIYSMDVKDGAIRSGTGATIGKAKYTGAGLNLGLGVDYFITDHFSTGIGATYRLVQYSEAEGPNSKGALPDNVSGDGYTVTINGAYHF